MAVLAATMASLSFGDALATIALVTNSRAGLGILPSNGYALAASANNKILVSTGKPDASTADRLAHAALRSDPVNPAALRALGLVADLRGNPAGSRPFFQLAQRATRRDLATNLWHIEDASQSGNLAATLYQYDIAIRTTKEAHTLLFSTLTTALEDAEIRQAFVPYFHKPPPWLPTFLDFAIDQSKATSVFADLAQRAGGFPKAPEYRGREGFLLDRLAVVRDFDAARTVYRLIPRSDPQTLTTIELTPANLDKNRAPISWKFFVDAEKGAEIESEADSAGENRLVIFAQPNVGGVVGQKLLYAAAGPIKVSAVVEFATSALGGSVTFNLNCEAKTGQTVIAAQSVPSTAVGRVKADFSANVTAACPVQSVTITTRGGSTSATEAVISGLRLARLPQRSL
ncbi:M48 family metallopeptidase [Sphingomonas sp. SUN039]|uniref:tetratricopeptide repeat protein n=1 Tax=Sphingomonas sp. SUN039 TaxID=2937787 RepID=UPI0021640BAD|nr:hypothetical protein [Sphingomonas sp. SUN039]UVO52859.1 hypothetical protein M0209_01505 [Sphingomonas sp. SUN039]